MYSSPLDTFYTSLNFDMHDMPNDNHGGMYPPQGLFATVSPQQIQTQLSPIYPQQELSPLDSATPSPLHATYPLAGPSRTVRTTARRRSPTGTRKYITPDSLLPLDAPIQPRKYVLPSATSRKDATYTSPPRAQQRKLPSGERASDEDELSEEAPLPASATELQQIEWRRRQNTLAARKSRQRKLQHQLELEDSLQVLNSEREIWRTRALLYEALLQSNGIMVPTSV